MLELEKSRGHFLDGLLVKKRVNILFTGMNNLSVFRSSSSAMEARFLVVSDSPEREILERTLRDSGLFGGVCTSSKQAIGMLRKETFQGILCDLTTSSTESMDLLIQIRVSFPAVAFVMVTSPKGLRDGILALIAGASGYLVKPLTPEAIPESARRALDRKHFELCLEKPRPRRQAS
jgi:DNA-binding NtrC family response regulator